VKYVEQFVEAVEKSGGTPYATLSIEDKNKVEIALVKISPQSFTHSEICGVVLTDAISTLFLSSMESVA
jgi:hypothetical protein